MLCVCVQVDFKNAEYRDDSVHELMPPQIRGVVPRLARRISVQQVGGLRRFHAYFAAPAPRNCVNYRCREGVLSAR